MCTIPAIALREDCRQAGSNGANRVSWNYFRIARHTISESNALSSMEMIAKDPLQRLLCMGRSRKPTSDV